jgi:HEXXH motif-containing protein
VPPEGYRWRLAEALLHEAGHLQLSLVERFVPLVTEGSTTFYSPWRRKQRPLRGVLHGLYVFGLIAEWIARSGAPADRVQRRVAEIRDDAAQLCEFPKTKGLTASGATLARIILARLTPLP